MTKALCAMVTKFDRKNPWPKHCIAGVKGHEGVSRSQPGVKLLRNALWQPSLVEKIHDRSVMQWWGQRSCRVNRGQPGVELLRNALWLLDLVGRTIGGSVMYCWDKRSCRGQPGSTMGQIAHECPMATKFGRKNSWLECNTLTGLKVMQGLSGVNQRANVQKCIRPPNVVNVAFNNNNNEIYVAPFTMCTRRLEELRKQLDLSLFLNLPMWFCLKAEKLINWQEI